MDLIVNFISQADWATILFSLFRIIFILLTIWLLLALIKRFLGRMEKALINRGQNGGEPLSESAKRAETLTRLVRQAIVTLTWTVALLIILREIGVDIAPILASAGILGLAVGFGAQNLVKDVIAGFFLILENQVRVGDVAIINDTGGLVEQVNFRTIILRDLSGTVHIFPNGNINSLANLTQVWSAYVLEIGIAYKEDVDHVMHIMQLVGSEMRNDPDFGPLMIDDMEIFGVEKFADSAVIIKGRLRTKPIRQWDVGREFLRRLKNRFDTEGIELPFPHRSLYFGEHSKPALAQLLKTMDEVQLPTR